MGLKKTNEPLRKEPDNPMHGTALLYGSHSRSPYIHGHFIAERALNGWAAHRILFLPMSTPDPMRQHGSWDDYRWFFEQNYGGRGLELVPFYWSDNLQKSDVDELWRLMWDSEVVVLGGGYSTTGIERFKHLGERFDGEWGKFGRILHERAARGLLNVGFSAGADQMAQYMFRKSWNMPGNNDGFGCARNVMVLMHYEKSEFGDLCAAASQNPHCLVFGLPNDSGLYLDQGALPSGNLWQRIETVIDESWDNPNDQFHIKTRQGVRIESAYSDGRQWVFNGGDQIVRIQSPDLKFHEVFVKPSSGGPLLNYWTQKPSNFDSIESVLASY